MTEQELVKKCLNAIIIKNGYENTQTLTQRDFEQLSKSIEDKTDILISVSTIKRLSNGDFNRLPQIATLNAISNYLDFKNWQEYKILTQQKPLVLSNINANYEDFKFVKSPKYGRYFEWKWTVVMTIIFGVVAMFIYSKFSNSTFKNHEKAQFIMKKTTTNTIPNTVIFTYNIDEVDADSFFIQQSWDKNKRVKIFKNNYTLTDIYYEPGYHTAKLFANDSIIKTVEVSIPTDKWFLYVGDKFFKNIPQYFKNSNPIRNGQLGLDKIDLEKNQIKSDEEKVFFYTYFPSKITESSDNYNLKARVRMKEIRNNQCPYIMYEIFSQKYFNFFKSYSKGCASEAIVQFGEKLKYGKKVDLSFLCTDVFKWSDIQIIVKNKTVTIFINQKQAFSSKYDHSSGLITGLGFISNGLCDVDYVELKSLDGKVIYESQFLQPQLSSHTISLKK